MRPPGRPAAWRRDPAATRPRRPQHEQARVAPVSYAASLAAEALVPPPSPLSPEQGHGGGQGRGRRPLENAAAPSALYLHPMGKKSLRLYAVERGVKVHDLLLEAVEAWATDKGLAGP